MTIRWQAACVADDSTTKNAQKLILYHICQKDIDFTNTLLYTMSQASGKCNVLYIAECSFKLSAMHYEDNPLHKCRLE